jgi:hypothetical protein
MARQCGTCTKCCELLPVAELQKAGFTHCKHEGLFPPITLGCAIYAKRPGPCRIWSCWWLDNEKWPDELRPDRCGVVFDGTLQTVTIDGAQRNAVNAWVATGHEWDFRDVPAIRQIVGSIPDNLALLWHVEGYSRLIHRVGNTINCSEPRPRAPTPGLIEDIPLAVAIN